MKQKYIIRTDRAGVFYGFIESREGSEAVLTDARRVWRWEGATDSIQLAMEGCKPSSKLTVAAESLTVLGVIEIIPVTDAASERMDAIPIWRA
jgi:hypothetical protein